MPVSLKIKLPIQRDNGKPVPVAEVIAAVREALENLDDWLPDGLLVADTIEITEEI